MAPDTVSDESGSNGGSWGVSGHEMPEYMAAQPKRSQHHSGSALVSLLRHGQPTKIEARFERHKKMQWQQKLSMLFVYVMWRVNTALKLFGFLVEWTLNFLALNHGVFSLLYKFFFFKWGEVVRPKPDSENYYSLIGHLDGRSTLFIDTSKSGKADTTKATSEAFPAENVGSRSTADVCIMAAKLAYENPAVIQKVVEQYWKMHFVKFYNCWNEYQNMRNTQAFVFMDKKQNANAVVVSFRGTEPFNSYDWSTDLDFSWLKVPDLGGVHLGFLEALGLGSRDSMETFLTMRNKAIAANKQTQAQEQEQQEGEQEPQERLTTPPTPHHKTKSEILATTATSGLSEDVIDDATKELAYDDITKHVALLLNANPNAKLFVTGHSLGGALAALYATMLDFSGQAEVVSKLAAVYTFGQPRVGDQDFAAYASKALRGRYFRVVYCNDVVPRVPFDNALFAFKHFGDCDYFNSVYDGFTLEDVPNKNFFQVGRFVTMHLNAVWELLQGMVLIARQHGEGFRESRLGMLARVAGVFLPGVAAHSPCNYVNSVRLGPLPLAERLRGDIVGAAKEFRLMQDNLMDIAHALSDALWEGRPLVRRSDALPGVNPRSPH